MPVTADCTAAGRGDRDDRASPLFASSAEDKAGGIGQKSRSLTSWPILACSFSTSFCDIGGSSLALPPNADAMFEIAVFVGALFHWINALSSSLQSLIIVGWIPYFLGRSFVSRYSFATGPKSCDRLYIGWPCRAA